MWEPKLLEKLRATGRILVAIDFCGACEKTVRRHILRDKDRLGDDHPEALGVRIKAAKRAYAAAQRSRRRRREEAVRSVG